MDQLRGFPTASYLRVGYTSTLLRNRSFLQHEFADLPGTVTNAQLKLYQYDAKSCTPTTLTVYPIAEQWYANDHEELTGPEAGVWWKTPSPDSSALKHRQPAVNTSSAYTVTEAFAHGTTGCGNASESIDVTKIVKAWNQDTLPNYGLALRASDTDQNAYKGFCSRNVNPSGTSCNTTARVPSLVITYNNPPSVAVALSTSEADPNLPGSVCMTGPDRPTIATATPTLNAFVEDSDLADGTEPTRFHAEVWKLDGSALVASGDSTYVQQDTLGAWTVASGALSNGSTYKWRALGEDGAAQSAGWSEWCEFAVDTALAEPFMQASIAVRSFYEHFAGPSPTVSEGALRATDHGRADLLRYSTSADSIRAAEQSAGLVVSAITSNITATGPGAVGAGLVSLPIRSVFSRTESISGEPHSSTGSDDWLVGLILQDGAWIVDTISQVYAPELAGDETVDPNQANVDLENIVTTQATSPTGLNKSAAVNYALQWSKPYLDKYGRPKDEGRSNPRFIRYENNCQNFVSQSLLAGGWVESSAAHPDYGRLGTWFSVYTPQHAQDSQSWRLTTSFFSLIKKRGATLIYKHTDESWDPIKDGALASRLRAGDIVMYDFDTNGVLNHSQLVTSVRNSVPNISQNSRWRRDTSFLESLGSAKNSPGKLTVYVWRP